IIFELVRMTPNLAATLTLVAPRTPRFAVTPKGRTTSDRDRIAAPRPLVAALGFSAVAGVVYLLSLLHLTPIEYRQDWAAAGAFAWLIVNAGLMLLAIRRVRSLRFAGERRSAVRFAVDAPGWVDAAPVTVQDVSVGGALLATGQPLVERDAHLLTFELSTGLASVWARVRSVHQATSGEVHYAFEFEPGQHTSRAMITRAIFDGDYPVAGADHRAWADLLRTELAGLSARFRHTRQGSVERPIPVGAPLPERPATLGRPTASGAAS
ncbi:MAG TPA: PilZ domain-containing protein, partial [Candidatus Limnocylindria bacterium]|nr:PilZ domain-containing protein [Candidatus Limnocylindria bacterium]